MGKRGWNFFDQPYKKVAVLSANLKNLRSISRLLWKSGVLPIPFTDETEFLSEGQSDAYDAIIVDSQLAKTGVGELTQILLETVDIPPIVVTVDKSDINSVVNAIRAGASDVLSLPFSSQHLARHLRNVGVAL